MKMLLKHSLTEEALTLAAPRKQWRAPDSWPTALQEEDSTAAPGGCPSFHFSTLFPPPPRHLCSGFWLVVHRCSSCGMQLSCPCIPGSTEFKCSGSHRSLDPRLPLDGDTCRKSFGEKDVRWAEKQDGPLSVCTKYCWDNCVSLIKMFFGAQKARLPHSAG